MPQPIKADSKTEPVKNTEEAAPTPVAPPPEVAHQSTINATRDALRAQPKVQVKVRGDADVQVQINGYTYLIQPNVKVSVPESVATLLEEGG